MRRLLAFVLVAFLCAPLTAATFVIVNNDGAGEGFNDPTAAAPVGGNPGTTVGQQRLNAFQFAADLWGSILDSDQTIFIQATFDPLTCTATSAVLGSAGAIQIFSDSGNLDFANTWYAVSLANKLSGSDLAPGPTNSNADDIIARFNSNLNGSPTCLGGQGWYYGFDANHGTNTDLVTVLLHEFGHGLNFANFVTETSGANAGPPFQTDVYSQFTLDNTLGQTWAQINPTNANDAAIQASAIRCGQIAWNGPRVTAAVTAGALQAGTPLLRVNTPASIDGDYQVGSAAFGPAISNTTGNVVLAVDPADGAGPSVNDACSPLTNAAAISGNIALVDRGTCGFVIKAANVQAAGAIAMVVADNVAGCPPPALGGADPSITIPAARISLADGNTIKAELAGGVNATLTLDPTRRAGADAANHALLAALNPVAPGSSISHFDSSHFPNSLMEPSINGDLNHTVNDVDLTFEMFQDIGWFKLDGSLGLSDSADPVNAGAAYSYVINANNAGSGTDRPVTVTAQLPTGAGFVSAVGTGWTCGEAAGVVTCNRDAVAGPNLPTGALPPITVNVTAPNTPGVVNSSAAINVNDPLIDPDTTNNGDTEQTTVVSPGNISSATKTVSGNFTIGGQITYTITLSNTSATPQGDNPGDEFTDLLPVAVQLDGAVATSGTIATGPSSVTWNGAIPANGSVTITITATILSGGQITNQGVVHYDADGDGNNDTTISTDDPGVGGTADPTSFFVGGAITIPTLGDFGLLALGLGVAGAATRLIRRRS
jgi:uncharacterized repeat protein (TIGR01451 family)